MMQFKRLFEILEYRESRPEFRASGFFFRENGSWRRWAATELLALRETYSLGILASGLKPGDRVGILAHCGSPYWLAADAALQQMGLIVVPIHAAARADEIRHIIQDTELSGCFVSNAAMLNLLSSAWEQPQNLLALGPPLSGTVSLETIAVDTPDNRQQISYRRSDVDPDIIATILYTSGTTGLPKGVMLTHANIISNVQSVLAIVPVNGHTIALSFLPLSHIFERMVAYVYQAAGTSVYFLESPDELPEALRTVRPEVFTAVPRILERMFERLQERRIAMGPLQRQVFDWAVYLGQHYRFSGERLIPFAYAARRLLADILVFRRWRKAMGGRLRYVFVGAAALQPSLGRLFSAAGIDVREGYGLTETSPVIAFNRFEPGGVRFGTVGMPAPGVEIRIAQPDENGEGEIEVRGPNVTGGYWNLPDESAARFTEDGWFRTGDLGILVHKRFYKITGRRSELFKTSAGKFVAPTYVETQLRTSPFIAQALVLGANQSHPGALILPDFVQLEAWCTENQVHWTAPQFMVHNPKVQRLIHSEIHSVNEMCLAPAERIRYFHLLFEPWTPENGLLTATLKLKRSAFLERYKKEIEELFVEKRGMPPDIEDDEVR